MSTSDKPTLAVFNDNESTREEFALHLASFCNQYVMEIAQPIMARLDQLYSEPSIVKLVNLWFEADSEYHNKRRNYLYQWGRFTSSEDDWEYEPLDSYKWVDKKVQAFKAALEALLIY